MDRGLLEELKQNKPFPSLGAEALVSILRTAAILDHTLADTLRPFGITPTQYNVLRILRGAGEQGLCGREIGERLIAKVPDVSRLLDRMRDLRLVTRERSSDDLRHVTARITPRGLALLAEAAPTLEALEARFEERLDAAQLVAVVDALARLRAGG